ncbi:MAG: D-alanyl-D-alanine carboxypeptidase [Rhodobacteraceae bacterium]|nr:D-alanyl-D-alanine carboxypeptidase [Paracoccaceae bacterium]
MIKSFYRGLLLAFLIVFNGAIAQASPGYAAFVMDARTGEVLHSRNADQRLHPASLTKMMTLYIVFTEIEAGRMSLDQMVTISRNAAAEPPSKLGVRAGSTISLRNLIRAAAVRSANDAATALGEAVSGSEAAFARYMTETARKMGMNNTHFLNAHGLTAVGHYSTARDMSLLGQRLLYDHPEYYNLFSRISTNVAGRTLYHTNRRFLGAYRGADGIKTGFTNAAGYNLTASARRGQERIIVTMFGGTSTAQRNARVTELMNMGFERAPTRATVVSLPRIYLNGGTQVATAPVSGLVTTAVRPAHRDAPIAVSMARNYDQEMQSAAIAAAIAAATVGTPISPGPMFVRPPERDIVRAPVRRPELGTSFALAAVATEAVAIAPVRATMSESTGDFAVQVGAFRTRNQAERLLIQTALVDLDSFSGALRSISPATIQGISMFQARFVGMSQESAVKACARLQALQSDCAVISPQS